MQVPWYTGCAYEVLLERVSEPGLRGRRLVASIATIAVPEGGLAETELVLDARACERLGL